MKKINISRECLMIILSVLCSILMIFLIFFQSNLLRNQKQLVEGYKLELEKSEYELKYLQGLKERSSSFDERRNYLELMLPEEAEEGQILDYLQRASIQSGMNLTLAQFSQRVSKSGFTEIPVFITLQGSYSGLTMLLEMTGKEERAFRINEINISKEGEGSSAIKAEVSVTAFYRE